MRFPTCLILTSAVCAVSAYAGVYVALLLAGCVLAAVLALEAVYRSVCWGTVCVGVSPYGRVLLHSVSMDICFDTVPVQYLC